MSDAATLAKEPKPATDAIHVRRVRGGYIVVYETQRPRAHLQQNAQVGPIGLAAMFGGSGETERHEVVCTDLTEVNNLVGELLGG